MKTNEEQINQNIKSVIELLKINGATDINLFKNTIRFSILKSDLHLLNFGVIAFYFNYYVSQISDIDDESVRVHLWLSDSKIGVA